MTTTKSIILESDDYPLLGRIDFNPFEIIDELSGNSITFQRLCYLPIGLSALEAPPNPTTLHIQDTILIDELLNNISNTLTNDNITILDSSTNESLVLSNNNIINNSTVNSLNIQHIGGLDINIITDDNITLTSSTLGNIILDAPNINSYNYSNPICFTRERTDTFNYTLGGQTYENVYTTAFNIPYEFVADIPLSGYTSTNWKIDFALNCWNCSNTGDKGIALFIVFQDQSSNFYSPITYNALTPYAVWQNPSTFNNGTNSQFQNFNWCDYVDLVGLSGTGSGNLPLNMQLVFAGDSGFSCNFSINVSLTRTNLI